MRAYFLNEPATTIPSPDGGEPEELPARRSLQVNGDVSQTIGSSVRARAGADFFSDVTVQQTFHTNILEASQRSRRFFGNVAGSWGSYSLSGTLDWNETFFGEDSSTLNGSTPRVTLTRAEQPLTSWLYFTFDSEYVSLLREGRSDESVRNFDLSRVNVTPTMRVPFTRWPFLTINSSVAWHATYWSERIDPETDLQIESGIGRRYLDLESRITGPVMTKVWETPTSAYAERFKHIIEPTVTIQRTTVVDNFDEIVKLESLDSVVGGTTRIGYGVVNRFLARRRQGDVREVLSVSLLQSYYTDARAAQFDRQFRTSFNGTPPTKLTPVSLEVRGNPNEQVTTTVRAEYDTRFGRLQDHQRRRDGEYRRPVPDDGRLEPTALHRRLERIR